MKRGPLEIKATEKGSLDSASNVTLVNKVEGSTTIISIIEEGTSAYEGQVLVELDSSKLRDSATQQQILAEQADAALKQAVENLEIQKTQNESDIAAAQLKLDLAKLDLEKYELGDYIQEQNVIKGERTVAQEDKTRAEEKYEFSKRLSKKGYVTQSELEADRIAVTKARIALDVATEKLKVLDTYTHKRQIAEMTANSQEFARELERTKRKADAALTQAKANLSACKLTFEVETSKLKKFNDQIAACTIRAPQAGEVVYANGSNNDRRGGGQEQLIAEGAAVRERQAIINLPDYSLMQVNCRIHESRIGMIHEGLRAQVHVDASPGEVFNGVVQSVSTVPLSGGWPNRDLKEYAAIIKLTDGVEKVRQLKPGLTAEVEIQVDFIQDTLQLPVQAVVARGNKHYVFALPGLNPPELRQVTVGKTNDIFIEIQEKGSELHEGEQVVLNPWGSLSEEINLIPIAAEEGLIGESPQTPASQPGDAKPAGSPEKKGEAGPKKNPGSESAAPGAVLASADGAKGPQPGTGGPGPGGRDPAAFFARLDQDGDGQLTKAEVPERMLDRFDTLDANSDGSITSEEFATGMQRFPRPGGGPPGGPAVGGGAR